MQLKDSRLTKNCILFIMFVSGTVMGGMARNFTQITYTWVSVLGLIIALGLVIKPKERNKEIQGCTIIQVKKKWLDKSNEYKEQ